MKYVFQTFHLAKMDESKYHTFFFKKGYEKVYEFITNGNTCVAELINSYPHLPLRDMQTRLNELPKYIRDSVTENEGGGKYKTNGWAK